MDAPVASSPRARGLRSPAELAAGRPHGDRLRYMAGCRCAECRAANSAYECARARARKNGDWNGIVSADKARAHMRALSRQGVGRRAIGFATDIADSILHEIRNGRRKRIRARTERKILSVTRAQAGDRALVPAKRTWKLIDALLEEGYTVKQLAEHLRYKRPVLRFNRVLVTVRTAGRIERLYRRLTT